MTGKEKRLITSIPRNPLPYTNNIESKSKIVFTRKARVNALARKKSRFSDSIFSFENTIIPNPEISNNSVISSAKFVLNVANILVSINEEKTANTGMLNLKSNQRYNTAIPNPHMVSSKPIYLHE
jgi:hypothetical protein